MNLTENILLFVFIYGGLFLVVKLLEACGAFRNWWKNRGESPTPPSTASVEELEIKIKENKFKEEAKRKLEWKRDRDRFRCTEHWQSVRKRVLARAGYECEQCKRGKAVAVRQKHYGKNIQRWNFEEEATLSNLVALCTSCNKEFYRASDWDDPNHPWNKAPQRSKEAMSHLKIHPKQLPLFGGNPDKDFNLEK